MLSVRKLVISLILSLLSINAYARVFISNDILVNGFTDIKTVTPKNFDQFVISKNNQQQEVKNFCSRLASEFTRYKWSSDPCGNINWQAHFKTEKGNPLLFAEFGSGSQVTLLMGAVHADELSTVPIGFRFMKYLNDNKNIFAGKDVKVIVAPLVNPDGFFLKRPTRVNANGVDANRNFFTMDWYALAKKKWQTRAGRARDIRVFPGYFPNTEIETIFQIKLLEDFLPEKILTLHAPLGFLDYDGPGKYKFPPPSPTEVKAGQLVHAISQKSGNYKVVEYTHYPGSLGNYAGNERKIPTITLEFDKEDAGKANEYWNRFLPGILQSITYQLDPSDKKGINSTFLNNYSPFLKQI